MMKAYECNSIVDFDKGNIFVIRLDTHKMLQFDDDEYEYGLSCDYCDSYSIAGIPWVKFNVYNTLDDTRLINIMNYGGSDTACERGLHFAYRFCLYNDIDDIDNIRAWYRVLNK